MDKFLVQYKGSTGYLAKKQEYSFDLDAIPTHTDSIELSRQYVSLKSAIDSNVGGRWKHRQNKIDYFFENFNVFKVHVTSKVIDYTYGEVHELS